MLRLFLLGLFLASVAGITLLVGGLIDRRPEGAPARRPDPATQGIDGLPTERGRLLFLTKSAGYEHQVVKRAAPGELAHAEKAMVELAGAMFEVDCTQDPSVIHAANLARYDVVAFYTTGELAIPPEGREALLAWVRGGGGFVGVHSATDTCYEWPAYGALIGGRFDLHPWHQRVRLRRESRAQLETGFILGDVEITDEIYQFKDWSRDEVHVLLSLDTGSVDLRRPQVHRKDGDFALAWWRPYGEGRVFYTALGHRPEVWQDERFRNHLLMGMLTASRGRHRGYVVDDEGFARIGREESGVRWEALEPERLPADSIFRGPGHVATRTVWTYPRESWRNLEVRLWLQRVGPGPGTTLFLRMAHVDAEDRRGIQRATRIRLGDGDLDVPQDERWHKVVATLKDGELVVSLDGRVVETRSKAGAGIGRRVGHIGVEDPPASGEGVRIRGLRVRRLDD